MSGERCGAPYPEKDGVTCVSVSPIHAIHVGVVSWREQYEWPNEDFVEPAKPSSKSERQQIAQGLLNVTRRTRAVARSSHPDTSWNAARGQGDLTEKQREVYSLLVEFGPMTDEQIERLAGAKGIKQAPSGLRARRSELVAAGLVRWTGEKGVKSDTGYPTRIWAPISWRSGTV